jgi:hypothetical protein
MYILINIYLYLHVFIYIGTDLTSPGIGIHYYNHKSDTGEGTDIHQTAPWSYQADYYGVCTCIHQMLYLQPLATMIGTDDVKINIYTYIHLYVYIFIYTYVRI